MKSYTTGRNLYGSLTRNSQSANLTLGDQLANDSYRQICARRDWPFLERLRTLLTTANTQFTTLPYDCEQVREISVIPTGSTTRYTPRLSPSAEHWDQLNLTSFTSDIPVWYFVRNGQIGLWPTPASTGNTIYVTQKTRVIDLNTADYTTGTVTATTNGDATVTFSGTTLTYPMVGRYLRIDYDNGTDSGDGLWYEIASINSTTSIELTRPYGGTSIAAGSQTFTIGQMPLLPESFHDMPWLSAAGEYWAKEDLPKATYYFNKYEMLNKLLEKQWSSPTTSMVIDDGRPDEIINPNLTISL